jgi:proteasome accessory factor C
MDRFDRIFELHKLLSGARRPVPRRRIEEALECSKATVKRVIQNMRLYLNAPILYSAEADGYYYDSADGGMYQLPGVWFNASELHALLVVQQLLAEVQPGLLEQHLAPLRGRIGQLLQAQHAGGDELPRRIRILGAAARPAGEHFQTIAGALAHRRRLRLCHHHRGRDERVEREVSPQRLVHYRDTWYLDAWCHLREGLRTFGLDAIQAAQVCGGPCREVAEAELDAALGDAYGIFSGPPKDTALLRFDPQPARWVAQQRWHPRQQGRWLEDGRFELTLPYGETPELLMDILQYGPEVEVVAPEGLRRAVAERLWRAARRYAEDH